MNFTPFGPILIARNLVEDPFGNLSRAWERDPEGGIHPIFLRRFKAELAVPAVAEALAHDPETLSLPASCGVGHQFGWLPAPHWKVNHQRSRSVRRIQEKCREERIPLDPSLSLHVALTLAHLCARFWRAGRSVGPLNLDSVRVDFEGGLFLPDLGWMPTLIRLADRDPALRATLPELPRGPEAGDFRDEGARLGAFLFELFTFTPLPEGAERARAIGTAHFWATEEPRPLPETVRTGLSRLLGCIEPYETLEGALRELEAVVFEDEDGPSTFNLAHMMHTLFREDQARQRQEMETERAALQDSGAWGGEGAGTTAPPVVEPARKSHRGLITAGALTVAGITLGSFLYMRSQERHQQDLEAELAHLKSAYEQQVQRGGDEATLERGRMELQGQLGRLVEQAKNQAQREMVGKELERLRTKEPAARKPAEPAPAALAKAEEEPARPMPPPVRDPGVRPQAAAPAGADRPAQIKTLTRFPWPAGEPRSNVLVRVFVGDDGRPLRATLESGSSAGPRTAAAATEAALKSRYLPAIRGGKAVRDWLDVPFNP